MENIAKYKTMILNLMAVMHDLGLTGLALHNPALPHILSSILKKPEKLPEDPEALISHICQNPPEPYDELARNLQQAMTEISQDDRLVFISFHTNDEDRDAYSLRQRNEWHPHESYYVFFLDVVSGLLYQNLCTIEKGGVPCVNGRLLCGNLTAFVVFLLARMKGLGDVYTGAYLEHYDFCAYVNELLAKPGGFAPILLENTDISEEKVADLLRSASSDHMAVGLIHGERRLSNRLAYSEKIDKMLFVFRASRDLFRELARRLVTHNIFSWPKT